MMALIGRLGLGLRIVGYAGAGWLAANSDFVGFTPATGDLTVNIDGAADFLASGAVMVGTLVWRKVAKAKGGAT